MRRLLLAILALLPLVAGLLVAPAATAANTLLTNPLGFAYQSQTGQPGVAQYGRPTGMLVTGRCNRYAPEFAAARSNGAEILAYLNFVERNDGQVCAADNEFYGGPPGSTPLWPYPTPGQRVNWPGTHMTDITAGAAWADRAVAYIENLMRENKVDGVFLDVVGARLWSSLAAWDTWPQWERDIWTAGTIDFVKRLDASRRAINPRFIIVNNNTWDTPDGAGLPGESHVDGISLEHHAPTGAYHQRIAGKPYSNLGHRRLLVIARNTAEARQWAQVQGVTHVSDQTNYGQPTPPPIPFNRLTDRPKTLGRTTIATTPSAGMTANQKRGSKFTLPDKATLLGFSAYLDGLGGPTTGTQAVRMVIYKDSNGVPNGRWAQSNVATVNAGAAARWVSFTAPATPLDPGQYWIVMHSGDTGGIARNRGDGAANWYGNADPFADGPSNPFGTGSSGSVTLSVNVRYTVGH